MQAVSRKCRPSSGPSGHLLPVNGEKEKRYILTRSAFGSYIGLSEASAANRSPAISIS